MKNLLLLLISLLFFSACKYEIIVNNGSGSGVYDGAKSIHVNIVADQPAEGMRFYKWSYNVLDSPRLRTSINNPINVFMLNAGDAKDGDVYEYTAEFVPVDMRVKVDLVNGEFVNENETGLFSPGDEVVIVPDLDQEVGRYVFYKWVESSVPDRYQPDLRGWRNHGGIDGLASFTVGVKDVQLEAIYKEQYELVLDRGWPGGIESKMVFAGDSVWLNYYHSSSHGDFIEWIGDIHYLEDPKLDSQKFVMPEADIKIVALFKDKK